MSNRVILLLILLMCASFAAVLGVMWSAVSPAVQARPRPRVLPPMRVSPAGDQAGERLEGMSHTRRDKTLRPSTSRFDRPFDAPAPPPRLGPADEFADGGLKVPDESEIEDRARAAAELASRHLDRMESRLKRQIDQLEESRNIMLDELARELADMPPAEAAEAVAILDDETGALALLRLPRPARRKVLNALKRDRARRLQRLLNTLAEN